MLAHSLVTDLLCYVNDKVREQQNWRKTLDISLRLVKQPVERSGQPALALAELRVSNRLYCVAWGNNNNNKIIIITRTMFMVLSLNEVIARLHPVHTMNAEQRQMAADLWTKPTDLSHWPACRKLHPPSPFIVTQPES